MTKLPYEPPQIHELTGAERDQAAARFQRRGVLRDGRWVCGTCRGAGTLHEVCGKPLAGDAESCACEDITGQITCASCAGKGGTSQK